MAETIGKADAEKCINLKMVHYPAKRGPGFKLVNGQLKVVKSMNHKAWDLPLCEKHQTDCPIYRGLAHSCNHYKRKED
jgi:hypothetical protein